MALSDPLIVTFNTVPHSFVTTKKLPDGTERLNEATTLTEPEALVIRHSSTGNAKAGTLVDRHLVQFSRAERDAETGNISHCVLNFTLAVPRTGQFSLTEILRQVGLLKDLLTDANVGKLLRGES